jgi:hypothetical protein
MHASLVRRQLSGLVPPKIASPSILVSSPPSSNQNFSLSSYTALLSSRRVRVPTSAPSSHSTPSSPRAPRLSLSVAESRRDTSTARTPRRLPSSSPCWPFSDLGTPSTTRVRFPLTAYTFTCISLNPFFFFFRYYCLSFSRHGHFSAPE